MANRYLYLIAVCAALFAFPREGFVSTVGVAQVESEFFTLSAMRTFPMARDGSDAERAKRFKEEMVPVLGKVKSALESKIEEWKKRGIAFVPVEADSGSNVETFTYEDLLGARTIRVDMGFAQKPSEENLNMLHQDILKTLQSADRKGQS